MPSGLKGLLMSARASMPFLQKKAEDTNLPVEEKKPTKSFRDKFLGKGTALGAANDLRNKYSKKK